MAANYLARAAAAADANDDIAYPAVLDAAVAYIVASGDPREAFDSLRSEIQSLETGIQMSSTFQDNGIPPLSIVVINKLKKDIKIKRDILVLLEQKIKIKDYPDSVSRPSFKGSDASSSKRHLQDDDDYGIGEAPSLSHLDKPGGSRRKKSKSSRVSRKSRSTRRRKSSRRKSRTATTAPRRNRRRTTRK